MEQRIPPQNVEAEQAVLGAMLLSHDAVIVAMEKLQSQDFYRDVETMGLVPDHTTRALNREFEDKLSWTVIRRVLLHRACRTCVPNRAVPDRRGYAG